MELFDYMLGVEQGKKTAPQPSGTIEITENGTGIDVSQYATADVNVEANPYPINVTFMNGADVYEKTGVSSSNIKINKPDTDPEGEGVFAGWVTDSSEALETFPKNISEDTVFNAYYTEVRTDMEITDANEVLYTWNTSDAKKSNPGICVVGYNVFGNSSTGYRCCAVCLSRVSENACAFTGGYNNIRNGTLVYGDETWYYYRDRSHNYKPLKSFNTKAYNCNIEHDATENEVALATLNRYFNIS